MSGKSSSSGTLTIALLAALGLAAGGALWWTYQQDQAKTEEGSSQTSVSATEVSKESLNGQDIETRGNNDDEGVTVEDEASIDAEEEARKAAEAAEHKDKYDKAISMADKLMKGQRYLQASERYSEAIDILPHVPTAQGNILPLYNNRSAMYEKSGEEYYDKALNDIALVLQMEPTHMKARVRKARILEAKGKLEEALVDYTVHFYIEQSNGQVPSSSQKVEDISKKIAIAKSAKTFDDLLKESYARSGGFDQEESNREPVRSLPSKSYCRGLVELFPSVYKWKAKFGKPETVLQELTDRFNAAEDGSDKVALQSEVVTCAVAAENYRLAFTYLNKHVPLNNEVMSDDIKKGLKKLRAHLRGLEMHLRCNLLGAEDNFQGAESLDKGEPELVMLNAHVQLSLGNTEQALALLNDDVIKAALEKSAQEDGEVGAAQAKFPLVWQYLRGSSSQAAPPAAGIKDLAAELIANLSVESRLIVAFAFFLRPSCWVSRDAEQKVRPNAVALAMPDFQLVEALVQPIVDVALTGSTDYLDLAARNLLVLSLCKSVHLLVNTQTLLGQQPTPSDVQACQEFIQRALAVDPDNIQTMMLASDVAAMDGKFEDSLSSIGKVSTRADKDDGIPYVMKANIFTHQGMANAKNSGAEAETISMLKQAGDLYDEALRAEPSCVEAMAQACQLKCILGDMVAAAQLAEQVAPLGRSKDEIFDLEHLLVQTSSQISGLKELSAK
jgi:tetratricopeptide (TPR) repeat protein